MHVHVHMCELTCECVFPTSSLDSVATTSSSIKNYFSTPAAKMDGVIPGFSDLDQHEENFSWTVQKFCDNINHIWTGQAFYLKRRSHPIMYQEVV